MVGPKGKGRLRQMTRGKVAVTLHPPKMKPFWKMKKWFEIEDDFRWAKW
jgi:hypothetical protein